MASSPPPELERGEIIARNIGVGCLTTAAGFFSGGMIAVLLAKFVGSAQGCQPPEDFRHAIGGCMLVLERFSERLRCRFWRWVG